MLQLTSDAIRHLVQVRQERGLDNDIGVRFIDNGTRLGLTFAPRPAREDVVVKADGLVVSVPRDVASRLEKAVVDARREGNKTVLVLRRGETRPRGTRAGADPRSADPAKQPT